MKKIILLIMVIIFFPVDVNAAGNVEIKRSSKSLTIYSNNSNLGNVSRIIRTYNIENGVSYHISSNKLAPGDDKASVSYLISATNSPDLKQIGIIQYGKLKGYSDLAIQIALYLDAVWTDKAEDDFFAFPLTMYLDGKDPVGTGINQINDSSGEVKKAFEIFFNSSEITLKKNQTGYSSAVYNFECESGTCYYPSKNSTINISTLTKLGIPKDAIIKSITVDDGTTIAGNYLNVKASEATISITKYANLTICDNCASAKISIDYDHLSNVSIPELALPNGGEGISVINSSNMLTYKNATISTKTFTLFSGETSNQASETFHRLYTCDINLIVEGGVSSPSDADFKANTLQENLDDEKLVVDYSKIIGKRACDNSEYLMYSDEAASGNNFSNNRYCRIYCKEDVQINIPNKVIPPSNSNGKVFSGRYFTLLDLQIESKKTCITTKTDNNGRPTTEPGINLELFYKDVYGYEWYDGDILENIANSYGQTISALHELNNMNLDNLIIGSIIKIVLNDGTIKNHTITNEDTMIKIARIYDVEASNIRKTNNMTSDNLLVGTKIKVPLKNGSLGIYIIRSDDNRPSADLLNQPRSIGGDSGAGSGRGTPSGSNSQYTSNKCSKAIVGMLAEQSEDTSEQFHDYYQNIICNKYKEEPCQCQKGYDFRGIPQYENCSNGSMCKTSECADPETLKLEIEGRVIKGEVKLGSIRKSIAKYNLSQEGAASCFQQVLNALNLTGVDLHSSSTKNDDNTTLSYSINSVNKVGGNCTYERFMEHRNDTYGDLPQSQQNNFKGSENSSLGEGLDRAYQTGFSLNQEATPNEKLQEQKDLFENVYKDTYNKKLKENLNNGMNEQEAKKSAESSAEETARGEVPNYELTPWSLTLTFSNQNRLQEYVFNGEKIPESLRESEAYYEKAAAASFKSTEGSIEDLIECSTFYKYIDYDYKPEISFKYCDEYDIDYEMKGEINPIITVEYCKSNPSEIDYACPDSDKVVFELNKKEEIDGKSSSEILALLRNKLTANNSDFDRIITNLKYYHCIDQCTPDEVDRALISTNLGTKVEYTAKWTANSVTKYYSVLPTGVARTIPIAGRSILLGTDGIVFPVNITNKNKSCEYSFEIRNLGERKFEHCFPEMQNAYTCYFDIENEILKPCETCDSNGIQYFYRPISLNNVFPNSEGKASLNQYRTIGHNWNNEKGAETIKEIEAENDSIYANNGDGGNGPEYSYTITPIQAYHIRAYNEETENLNLGYADFNMTCDEYGKQCRSKWLDGQIGSCGGNANCGQYYFTDNMTVMPDDLSTRTVYFCTWQDGTSWKGATQFETCPYIDATQEKLEAATD